MDFTIFVLIVVTCQNIPSVSTEGCNSLQYLEIGMPGIIQCFFQENLYAVSWLYSERKESILLYKESEKSGIGYTSGEFDVFDNGSLVIRNVSVDHETIYLVSKFTSVTQQPTNYHITVKTIVKPDVPYPVIDVCPAGQQSCLITVNASSQIGCFVRNARPLINLNWVSLLFEGGRIPPSVYSSVHFHSITFTSHATVMYSLSQLSLLNVFVCQASSMPLDLIRNRESSVLIDKVADYAATGSPTIRYIEVHSTMRLTCSNNNVTILIWKKLVSGTGSWSTILYNIPPPNAYMESYQADFEVDNEGSLIIKSVSTKHEGLYVCIHNNDGIEDVTLYDVEIYVNPVPAYPVVDGCNYQQYCVLTVSNGDYITCSVRGISPLVELRWSASSHTDRLLFEDQNHFVTETEGVFDVTLTSRITFPSARKEMIMIECSVVKTSAHRFEMSTTIVLLFDNAVTTNPDHSSSVYVIVAIVAVGVIIIVIGMMIAMYFKLEGAPERQKQQTNKKGPDEENPMMPVVNDIVHTNHETNNESIFIAQLREKYEMMYDSVQPIPYTKDRMYCVDKVFVESDINYLIQSADARNKDNWKPLDSYHELLGKSTMSGDRVLLEGDPGYGKSTITLQLAYDWCNAVEESPLSLIKILIFLQLRQLGGIRSIFEAIRRFILSKDSQFTSEDVQNILEHSTSVLIVLDGYDEYPEQENEDTDIYKIISKDIFRKTNVLITTRTSKLPKHRAPQSYRLRLMGFGDTARDKYLHKAVAGNDIVAAENVKLRMRENPFLEDLCKVPLLFVMLAHITHENKDIHTYKSVTCLFRFMIRCFHIHMRNKKEKKKMKFLTLLETNHNRLDKIAFKALTGEAHQIVWKRKKLQQKLGTLFYDYYVEVGILVEDEPMFDDTQLQIKKGSLTEVRFYHKLVCEWYAAHYLSLCIKTTNNIPRLLATIDPFDLQYLYRFACGISKDASNIIIKYLRENRERQQLAILCLLEQERETWELVESITELVIETVTIHRNDTRLLQRLTIQILNVASKEKIPISELYLQWSYSKVDKKDILLQSGLRLPSLSSLEKISINANRAKLSEGDVIGLLNYGLQSQLFNEIWFYSCSLPESFKYDDVFKLALSRNIKVMRPSHGSQLDFYSRKWTKYSEMGDIRQLCSDYLVIDNKTSEAVQRSVIDVLEKASKNNISIFGVELQESFDSVGPEGIKLSSGLSLPVLSSLQRIAIATKDGNLIVEDEVKKLLSHLKDWEEVNAVYLDFCWLNQRLFGPFLQGLKSRKINVYWSPYGENGRSYQLDLDKGHWLLHEKTESLFPNKRRGDILTGAEHYKEER